MYINTEPCREALRPPSRASDSGKTTVLHRVSLRISWYSLTADS